MSGARGRKPPPAQEWPGQLRMSLREVLGASIHLEPLTPAEAPMLQRLNDLVVRWMGERFTYTWATPLRGTPRFKPEHLDLIPAAAGELKGKAANDYGVSFSTHHEDVAAPAYSYRFWKESTPWGQLAVVHLTAPVDHPPEEFFARVGEILAEMPIRWANLGYAYSKWEVQGGGYLKDLAPHARRHVGFDVDYYVGELAGSYAKIRSVNWLTVLGASMEAEWRAAGGADVPVERLGPHAVMRANGTPQRGDRDAGDMLEGYRRIDQAVRAVRAVEANKFGWTPWNGESTSRWLRRFEDGVPPPEATVF